MIHMHIVWYDRKPDFTPNYDADHHGIVAGATPWECMRQFFELRSNHDLTKYTCMEISFIY